MDLVSQVIMEKFLIIICSTYMSYFEYTTYNYKKKY